MDNPLPFFYYDILSRIVPGAATLAVLWPTKGLPPVDWLLWFAATGEREGWEKFVVPIVLVGLCYVIGVVYEVFDYFPDLSWFPGMKWVSEEIDNNAFVWCAKKYGDATERSLCANPKAQRNEIMAYRNNRWNLLTYRGGSQSEMSPVFEHCHRFQAEQKMFLHLLYPVLLFELLSAKQWFLHGQGLIGLLGLLLFFACCRSRSRRKWMQILAFSKIMNDEDKRTRAAMEPSPKPSDTSIPERLQIATMSDSPGNATNGK
ncbi:MAG: hypothetical protein P4L26_14425 [Terracidiphilus sp.]|nr:hypothetical protein [Terracidiphilus sp.]